MFKNRSDAGRQLASKLMKYANRDDVVVIGLPRGGVVTAAEVYTQARYVSERLKYEIRNATGINSVAATSISLVVSDGTKNPTVIDLSGGKVRVKWGAATAVNINSDGTNVSSLIFTDYTSGDSKTKHIGFVFTLTDNSTSVRQEYAESVSVRGSAEVRSN